MARAKDADPWIQSPGRNAPAPSPYPSPLAGGEGTLGEADGLAFSLPPRCGGRVGVRGRAIPRAARAKVPRASCPWGFPRDRGLPSPQATGRGACAAPCAPQPLRTGRPRSRKCPASANGASGGAWDDCLESVCLPSCISSCLGVTRIGKTISPHPGLSPLRGPRGNTSAATCALFPRPMESGFET